MIALKLRDDERKTMGLSASQARLLTITARKSDCEFQSMSLSHQKIALSRDMERISTEYQNSLNNTKLIYDYYGNGKSEMDLTYGLLMTPSVYNDYYPKLVTDSKNRVVLNSQYAAAARAAGIPAEGLTGTPSSDVRNAFIEALAANDIITPAKAVTIQSVPYANTIGIGSTVNATVSTSQVTYDELLELLKAKTVDTATYGVTLGQGGVPNTSSPFNGGYEDWEVLKKYTNGVDAGSIATGNSPSGQTLSITDLLFNESGNDYNLSIHTRKGEKIPLFAGKYLQDKIVGTSENDSGSVLNWITDQFREVLGGTTANDLALQYAYNQVFDIFYPSDKLTNVYNDKVPRLGDQSQKKGDLKEWCNSRQGGDIKDALDEFAVGTKINKTGDYQGGVDKSAINTIGMTYTYDYDHAGLHADRNDRSQISVNLNNIAEVFLTAFVEYQKDFDCDYRYSKGQGTGNLYDPNKDDFVFTVVTGEDVETGDTNLEANFYDTLFNKICLNGWSENDMIDDKEYMQEMMKSGMVYISSIAEDGFYYQGNYSTDTYINEVADTEAIAKAEAKYNTEKTKIQNKEDKIDIKMKNLDTEISSLTTEYDTTKQIITKSIEKSFKRYEA